MKLISTTSTSTSVAAPAAALDEFLSLIKDVDAFIEFMNVVATEILRHPASFPFFTSLMAFCLKNEEFLKTWYCGFKTEELECMLASTGVNRAAIDFLAKDVKRMVASNTGLDLTTLNGFIKGLAPAFGQISFTLFEDNADEKDVPTKEKIRNLLTPVFDAISKYNAGDYGDYEGDEEDEENEENEGDEEEEEDKEEEEDEEEEDGDEAAVPPSKRCRLK